MQFGMMAELLPVRPFPLDMTTWVARGHGRILVRMARDLPGLEVDLGGILPEVDGVVDRLAPMRMRPTRRTPTALWRMARLARRYSAENWTQDPRFAAFERAVARLRAVDVSSLSWPRLLDRVDEVFAALEGFIDLRIDYLPEVGVSLARLRLLLAVLGLTAVLPRADRRHPHPYGRRQPRPAVAGRADRRPDRVRGGAAGLRRRVRTPGGHQRVPGLPADVGRGPEPRPGGGVRTGRPPQPRAGRAVGGCRAGLGAGSAPGSAAPGRAPDRGRSGRRPQRHRLPRGHPLPRQPVAADRARSSGRGRAAAGSGRRAGRPGRRLAPAVVGALRDSAIPSSCRRPRGTGSGRWWPSGRPAGRRTPERRWSPRPRSEPRGPTRTLCWRATRRARAGRPGRSG